MVKRAILSIVFLGFCNSILSQSICDGELGLLDPNCQDMPLDTGVVFLIVFGILFCILNLNKSKQAKNAAFK